MSPEKDAHHIGTQFLGDNIYLKIFRPSRLRVNKAKRFKANCELLHRLRIRAPTVTAVLKVHDLDACQYEGLRGKDLASFDVDELTSAHIERILATINILLENNIYFRALHAGNIIFCKGEGIGLIDVDDCNIGLWNKVPCRRAWIRKRMIKKLFEKVSAPIAEKIRKQILMVN